MNSGKGNIEERMDIEKLKAWAIECDPGCDYRRNSDPERDYLPCTCSVNLKGPLIAEVEAARRLLRHAFGRLRHEPKCETTVTPIPHEESVRCTCGVYQEYMTWLDCRKALDEA